MDRTSTPEELGSISLADGAQLIQSILANPFFGDEFMDFNFDNTFKDATVTDALADMDDPYSPVLESSSSITPAGLNISGPAGQDTMLIDPFADPAIPQSFVVDMPPQQYQNMPQDTQSIFTSTLLTAPEESQSIFNDAILTAPSKVSDVSNFPGLETPSLEGGSFSDVAPIVQSGFNEYESPFPAFADNYQDNPGLYPSHQGYPAPGHSASLCPFPDDLCACRTSRLVPSMPEFGYTGLYPMDLEMPLNHRGPPSIHPRPQGLSSEAPYYNSHPNTTSMVDNFMQMPSYDMLAPPRPAKARPQRGLRQRRNLSPPTSATGDFTPQGNCVSPVAAAAPSDDNESNSSGLSDVPPTPAVSTRPFRAARRAPIIEVDTETSDSSGDDDDADDASYKCSPPLATKRARSSKTTRASKVMKPNKASNETYHVKTRSGARKNRERTALSAKGVKNHVEQNQGLTHHRSR